jgi:hypothetical protein
MEKVSSKIKFGYWSLRKSIAIGWCLPELIYPPRRPFTEPAIHTAHHQHQHPFVKKKHENTGTSLNRTIGSITKKCTKARHSESKRTQSASTTALGALWTSPSNEPEGIRAREMIPSLGLQEHPVETIRTHLAYAMAQAVWLR